MQCLVRRVVAPGLGAARPLFITPSTRPKASPGRVRSPHCPPRRLASAFSSPSATIYALSTAPGRAALAIVRISGPASLAIHARLCPGSRPPRARRAALRTLRNPADASDVLDPGALVLFFPGPASATGEDVLELHVHGGPATVRAVLAGVAVAGGPLATRPAEPGEFTRRAFLRERLSLPQVEALGATLVAETESQRRAAASAAGGALAARYEAWRAELVAARGELEALIDFAEDQHFDQDPGEFVAGVAGAAARLRASVVRAADNAARGELLRAGVRVALLGPPNAGKSSLLNAAAGRDAAIVSAEAGTTRDVVEVGVDVGGFACRFGDLAGLRGGRVGAVESEGMRRATDRALAAQVVAVVLPVARRDGRWVLEWNDQVLNVVRRLDPERQRVLLAANKVDLLPGGDVQALRADLPPELRTLPACAVSCVAEHPRGVQPLLQALAAACADLTGPLAADDPAEADADALSLGASERQRVLLLECVAHLDAFLQRCAVQDRGAVEPGGGDVDVVLAAEDLRAAADCLGRLTGRGDAGDVEEVLGVVFEKFCVGK